jgi:hypothetical protein
VSPNIARRISLIGACPSPRPFAIGFTAGLDGEQIASLTLAVEGITTGIFRQSTVAALAPIRVGGVGLRIARTLERWLSRNDDYGMSGLGAEVC